MARHGRKIYGALLLVLFVTAAPLLAQDHAAVTSLSLSDAAAQVATAISQTKANKAIVSDFASEYLEPSLDGAKLAEDFSVALSGVARGFRVEGQRNGVPRLVFKGAFVFGQLWVQNDQLRVTLNIYNRKTKILTVVYVLRAPEGVHVRDDTASGMPEGYPRASQGGYSSPMCISCPQPVFTNEAVFEKVQGLVGLYAVVDATGHIQDVTVFKGLPAGLTQQAIKTVKGWRLAPAKGPDGMPATIAVPVEVTFKLL